MPDQPIPLHVLTLDALCNELVSGRVVATDDEGGVFQLDEPDTRSLFEWYRGNRAKWDKQNTKTDVEALVDGLGSPAPELDEVGTAAGSEEPKVLHLKSIRAHRFAGLHRYCAPDAPPPEFYFEFERPLTVIEGMNGAGKTSILSAICWCLNGYVLRSQRKPETAEELVALAIGEQTEMEEGGSCEHDMSCITPVPPEEVLASLNGEKLPLDTWVELTFTDDEGNELTPVRRSLTRTSSGRIKIEPPDLSPLGLDPVSYEVGSRLPGLIPYIQVGSPSDLGSAVAELTGLAPLLDLADHARKSKSKLEGDLVQDRRGEIQVIDGEFLRQRNLLGELVLESPAIAPEVDVAEIAPETVSDEELNALAEYFDQQEAQTFEEARSILGEELDPAAPEVRDDLAQNVGPALGYLATEVVQRLPSISRLEALSALSSEEIAEAEELLRKLKAEAEEVVKLDQQPEVAVRERLYARIANWLRDLPQVPATVQECPVCQSVLTGKMDPITDKAISDSIEQYLAVDSSHLENTIEAWEQSAVAALASELPQPLRDEVGKDLPQEPADLLQEGWGTELFDHGAFTGSLAPLKLAAAELCARYLADVTPLGEPAEVDLPDCMGHDEGGFRQAADRLLRAIAFARWAADETADCDAARDRVIGSVAASQATLPSADREVEDWTLSDRLVALDRLVRTASPLRQAAEYVATMNEKLTQRREKEDRIELYGRAAEAVEPLLQLGDLVEQQVNSLVGALGTETLEWRRQLYSPAYVGAPEVARADVESDGSLHIDAAVGGTRASALHISNASDLRATLLAFLLAFWKHLLDTRGGLSLLLLDDPQELLDPCNLRRMAATVPLIAQSGGRPIVTTNSVAFRRMLLREAGRALGGDRVEQCSIHPLNAQRSCVHLGCFAEDVDKKRKAFEDPASENAPQPARDYVNSLRIYLDAQLTDLLDETVPTLPNMPTLADLVNAVRARRASGSEAFAGPVFGTLVSDPTLDPTGPFVSLMNESHHGRSHQITYAHVLAAADDCRRVRQLVDQAHEEYLRWLRRDPPEPADARPAAPDAVEFPEMTVPLIEDLAAFTVDRAPTGLSLSEDAFDYHLLGGSGLYVIASNNFGFAAPYNCRAVVDVSDGFVEDGRLVIALHRSKAYARRLIRDIGNPRMIVLSSEDEDPRRRPPAVILPANEVTLLKVVGVLFSDEEVHPRPSEEAQAVGSCRLLEDVEAAYRVQGISALPLALPGQIVLGGDGLRPDELAAHEGKLVALDTSEGAALKRVGDAVADLAHVRQFESVGGRGSSMVVRTEDVEGPVGSLPLLYGARLVLGVIYGST